RGALSIDYFIPKRKGISDISEVAVDLETNYMITQLDADPASLYAIGGLHYFNLNSEVPSFGTINNGSVGLTLGIGSDFEIDAPLTPFAEVKYYVNDVNFLGLLVGVKFVFE
ncbi:MAG: hypothetical protein AB8B61_02565, partial [Cyclobacteriaceae bacterium]